jgi:hypothetical protein
MKTLTDLVPADFEALTEPLTLEVRIGDTTVSLPLSVEAVRALPPHRLRALPFSLTLAGPRAPGLPQGTYALSHPLLGTLEMFLVPVSEDAHARRYEVTVN